MKITAVILTLNEAEHITECIRALSWTDDIVVFDSYSQDETPLLAEKAGAKLLQSTFLNYAQQRNAALDAIDTDWILFVDADERTTPALAAEIRSKTAVCQENGWYIPRHNYLFGKLTLGAGWYPDYQLRLFRHGKVHYERPVHEIAVVDGDTAHLVEPLTHYNYKDPAHFHQKQQQYTRYDAEILFEQGVQPKPYTYITQPLRHFYWRFVIHKGYRDGWHGLRLSSYMAYYEWRKYQELRALRAAG